MLWKKVKKIKSNRQKKWQVELFREIWEERNHYCEVCWNHIQEPKTYCFAHILSKWRYPEYKFLKQNIALVCSLDCHGELDKRNAHNDYQIKQYYDINNS